MQCNRKTCQEILLRLTLSHHHSRRGLLAELTERGLSNHRRLYTTHHKTKQAKTHRCVSERRCYFTRLAPACFKMPATLSTVSCASVALPEMMASRMEGK
jgi:hypothetical protein